MSNDDKRRLAIDENGGNSETDPVAFLRRWSERKLEHPGAGLVESQSQKTDSGAVEEANPHDGGERELTDADMPPIETLNEHSDYRGFFSSKVSAELRRLALRKLFHSPVFNVTDGLDDYAEDYTTFAKLGNIVTHDMRRMIDLEAQRSQDKPDSDTAPTTESGALDDNDTHPSGDEIAGGPIKNHRQEALAPRDDEDMDA